MFERFPCRNTGIFSHCRFVVFCRKLFVFCNFLSHLHTIFLFCRFLSCFSNAFSSVLFLYLFMNHSLLLFFRVLQNVFACIFFLVTTLFFILVLSALLFPFLLQESFVNVFSKCILPKIASLLIFVVYYKCFFAIFYFCCDFVFIIVNADVTFFLFLSKGFFKRFFFVTNSCFFVVFIKMFLPAFFSCCNFVFILVISALLFPFCYRKIFGWFFNRIFTENCLLFAFLRHFASRAFTLQENSLLSFFCNCRFFLQL